MASRYAAEHAGALADIAAAGSAVTFSRAVAGTISDATDVETGATTLSITGEAFEDEPDSEMFRSLGLTRVNGVSLFFAPDTLGVIPEVGDTVTWGGKLLTVKGLKAYDIDGQGAIMAKIALQR